MELAELIREAQMFGSAACDAGRHNWEPEGGRDCPQERTYHCGQAVYRCAACGVHDYGEPGGPGHQDCATSCGFRHYESGGRDNGRQKR
jgi:hypothetical protein